MAGNWLENCCLLWGEISW